MVTIEFNEHIPYDDRAEIIESIASAEGVRGHVVVRGVKYVWTLSFYDVENKVWFKFVNREVSN